MIDVHCHMLPGIDDGSKSIDMSLEMLRKSYDQGIEGVIFTPHFYADLDSPDSFLSRRENAYQQLINAIQITGTPVPRFTRGAEVHYYRGISRSADIERLCIGRSSYILIEMPFRPWQPAFIDEIEEIGQVVGLTVIIAHIERYLDQDKKLVKRILENQDLLIQSNAEFFIEEPRKALKMFKSGRIDLLGSDSHNLTYRKPNLREAIEIIEDKRLFSQLENVEYNSTGIFEQAI
ncbi:protein-tyrosine phosphatase [Ruminococcaceae bacterium YRB3002]|nr:protein-tyrosine phosphatase [Ruminococcaceae bacterium YRB3002]